MSDLLQSIAVYAVRRAVPAKVADQVFKLLVHHIGERSGLEIVYMAFDYGRCPNGRPVRGVGQWAVKIHLALLPGRDRVIQWL
jgi:hypothetical protein